MKLDKTQKERAQGLWRDYVANGEKFRNARKEYSQQELDQRRRDTIPEIMGCLNKFLQGEIPLEEFKTVIDGINKRTRLWGFQGINGQMFFNVLTKNSTAGNRMEDLISLLKKALPVPASQEQARVLIEDFVVFTRDLAPFSPDPRGAPKVGSIPFFLSYFWQIQAPDRYPAYYSSMVNSLRKTDIWIPTGNVAEDYVDFYELNHALRTELSQSEGRELHIWDVEHAFWFQSQSQIAQTLSSDVTNYTEDGKAEQTVEESLPDSYIPPVVSILPRLAIHEKSLAELCRLSGKDIENVFEERLVVLFGMLGYQTELLGQGHGRVPDGVAICDEHRYAIIFDAKVRQQPYTMGTDERAIREYIAVQGERLRKRGIRNLYFMVISSSFSGDHDDTIRSLKIDMNVNEILLVEVSALLAMLEGRLRNSDISLGSEGIQRLLASSGVLTEGDVREFLEI